MFFPYGRYHSPGNDSAHNVIGQEFHNVVAVLDRHFYYNEEGMLSTRNWIKSLTITQQNVVSNSDTYTKKTS